MPKKLTITKYLDHLARRQHIRQRERREVLPMVGIFWFMPNGAGEVAIISDTSTLLAAEDYGDFKTHSRDHYTMWDTLSPHLGPNAQVEYEEWPRGRVTYDGVRNRFTVLADNQLLREPYLSAILNAFRLLRTQIDLSTDAHYRGARKLPAQPICRIKSCVLP